MHLCYVHQVMWSAGNDSQSSFSFARWAKVVAVLHSSRRDFAPLAAAAGVFSCLATGLDSKQQLQCVCVCVCVCVRKCESLQQVEKTDLSRP